MALPDGSTLAGRVCVVTGAGRGIGRGIALELAANGASVAVLDIDSETASAVATEIADGGGQAAGLVCDVSDPASLAGAIERATAELGPLSVMFNNAGVARAMGLLEIEASDWDAIMRVNAFGVLAGTQAAARQFRRQSGPGKIVNTASIAGREGFPMMAVYCASKAAVISLTQSAARELAGDGITVNAFCPGVVTTTMIDGLLRDYVDMDIAQDADVALEQFGSGIALGRTSTPDDVAPLAVFLASAASDYITGQAINVDGGMVYR